MALTGQNFQMWEKDTIVLQVSVTDDNNNPVDLSNVSLTWVLFLGTTSYANKTIGNGIVVTQPTSGIFQITISPLDTVGVTGLLNHECYLVDQYGNMTTILTGIVTITQSSPFK